MEPVTLAATATKAVVSAAAVLSRHVLPRQQRRKLADAAAGVVLSPDTDRFVDHLSAVQVDGLRSYVESTEFENLTRQAIIFSVDRPKSETSPEIRGQIWGALHIRAIFDGADLTQATDAVEKLVYAAVFAFRQSAFGTLDNARAVAMAADVTAAGVRNADLMHRLTSMAEINKFADDVRAHARTAYGKLRLASHSASRKVDYARLYVPPTLRATPSTLAWYPSTADTFAVADVVAFALRLVILGDPGAGKSTLAAKVAHDIATGRFAGLVDQIPILLAVRSHTQSLRADHETLLHYLTSACRRPGNLEPPIDALEYLLLNGRITVIIDGVDELGDATYRQSFADLVDSFARRYPLTRVIVTSRIIGYSDAPLDAELFPTVNVASFDDSQVTDYARHWFALEAPDPARRTELTDAFLSESVIAADLRSNPLMLSLLCELYSHVRYIPRNRPDIYEKCAELLFETWDRSRGIEITHRYGAHIRPAVQHLAWTMLTDARGRQVMPRGELVRALADHLGNRFDDPDEAAQQAGDFLDFCAGRAWVLTDTGADRLQRQYGFVHRTFLEYFAATQLVRFRPDADSVWRRLQPCLLDGGWEVVGQIAVQVLDRAMEGGADQLLDLIVQHQGNMASAHGAYLAFATRSLDTVIPGAPTLRRIAQRAVEQAADLNIDTRRLRDGAVSYQRAEAYDKPLSDLLRVPCRTTRNASPAPSPKRWVRSPAIRPHPPA